MDWVWDTIRKGSLASVTSGATATLFNSYDQMGRVKQSVQRFGASPNNTDYVFNYTYNAAGALETEVYPASSGRTIATCYDGAGRISAVQGTKSGTITKYSGSSAIQYADHGAISQMSPGDKMTETWTYDTQRLMPTSVQMTSTASGTIFGQSPSYCPNQATGSCATNNGNVLSLKLAHLGNSLQKFTYDHLNRICTANEATATGTQQWNDQYGYDAYGNLSAGTTSCTLANAGDFNSKNQLTTWGAGYDAAGNQTQVGVYKATWDSEGRMVKNLDTSLSTTTIYTYDGDGRRVIKQ